MTSPHVTIEARTGACCARPCAPAARVAAALASVVLALVAVVAVVVVAGRASTGNDVVGGPPSSAETLAALHSS